MSKKRLSQGVLLPLLSSHVLEHGLGATSLRSLAQTAGTSDRMLLYHFGTKDRLVLETLAFLTEQYAAMLSERLGGARAVSRDACLDRVLAVSLSDEAAPFLALWMEIVAGAARDAPGHREAAHIVMERMMDWLRANLPENEPDLEITARHLLTIVQGAEMLHAIGCPDLVQTGIAAPSQAP